MDWSSLLPRPIGNVEIGGKLWHIGKASVSQYDAASHVILWLKLVDDEGREEQVRLALAPEVIRLVTGGPFEFY